MNIPESDLFYEKAGENEAVREELLASLQKKRSDCLKGVAWISGVVMVLGLLAFVLLLYPVFTPQQPHPVLGWVSKHFQMLAGGVGLLFLLLMTRYVLPATDYDRQIKMLLLLRGKWKGLP